MGYKANEGKKQKPIRFEKWMADAIQEIADSRGLTFTAVVHELLRQELAVMGYSMGIGREAAEKEVRNAADLEEPAGRKNVHPNAKPSTYFPEPTERADTSKKAP